MQRDILPNNRNIDLFIRRANALKKLEKLRMKRREEVPRGGGRQKSIRIPVPPTPPAREVNPATLTFLFEKRLKYSDIKDEGRIVVPKSFAERFMPPLESKEGFFIFMDDLTEVKIWRFRYRFWPNNTSRVYVLENTTEFVKAHQLGIGDFLMIYRDNDTQRFAIGMRRSNEDTTAGQSGTSSSTSSAADQIQNFPAHQSFPSPAISTAAPQNFHGNLQFGPEMAMFTASQNFHANLQSAPGVVAMAAAAAAASQNFHANLQSAPGMVAMAAAAPLNFGNQSVPEVGTSSASASSYSDGLQDFPMHLLDMDEIEDLPEY